MTHQITTNLIPRKSIKGEKREREKHTGSKQQNGRDNKCGRVSDDIGHEWIKNASNL